MKDNHNLTKQIINKKLPVQATKKYPPNQFDKILDKYIAETILINPIGDPSKARQIWEKSLRLVYTRKRPLVCIDVEAYERNTKKVTEIGISIYDPKLQLNSIFADIKPIHIIISENIKLNNSKYVPDNKRRFMGGESYLLSLEESRKFITMIVEKYIIEQDGVIVGHSVAQDIKWIKSLNVKLPENVNTVDTKDIYSLTRNAGATLRGVLRHVDIPHGYLHNAGNDAYYTLLATLAYCDPSVRISKKLDEFKDIEKLSSGEKVQQKFSDEARVRVSDFEGLTSTFEPYSSTN